MAVAALLAVGPSGGPAPAAHVEARLAARSVLPPEVERAAARLDALTIAITGGVAELRASEVVNYHRVEGGVAACMAAAGRAYQRLPLVSRYAEFTDADLGYGTGRASILDSVTEGGRRLVRNEIAAARMARAGVYGPRSVPVDAAALNRCTAPYEHRPYVDIDVPAGAYELAEFTELLEAVGRDPDVLAGWQRYGPCMRERLGVDVEDRSEFLFRPRLPYGAAPVDGEPPSAAWTRGVAELTEAFAIDAQCRLPSYIPAMRVVAATVDGWEQRHQAELDRIRAEWRQRVAQAERLPR